MPRQSLTGFWDDKGQIRYLSWRMTKNSRDSCRVPHEDAVMERLRRDSAFAAASLEAAIQDADEPRVLLIALRRIGQARGGAVTVKPA